MADHTLTFTDWDNYTDGQGTAFTLDWSSEAAMRGKPAYPYMEALRQALLQRQGALDLLTWGDVSITDIIPGEIADPRHPAVVNEWTAAIANAFIYFWHGLSEDGYWIVADPTNTLENMHEEFFDLFVGGESYMVSQYYYGDHHMLDVNQLMSDAGITDAAFSDFIDGNTLFWTHNHTTLFPWPSTLRNYKMMISLLKSCVKQVYGIWDSWRHWWKEASSTYNLDGTYYCTTPTEAYSTLVSNFAATTWIEKPQ